ncbi:MAG: DUF58 domain-containing protein [Pseudobdellovibrionaceae bacterium]
MLPVEVLKKIKRLEIRTRKLVNNLFAGQYHTHFKGQGMTFADFREYVAGDDVRAISWPLTARTGKTFIKRYEEEREMTVILAVDISGSTEFGSGSYFKGEVLIHLAAAIAFAAVKNNDQVGLLLFSDQVEHFVPPGKGRGQVQRILRDLYFYKPVRKETKISAVCQFLQGFLKKRSSVFILSDFLDSQYDAALRTISKKHEVVACIVKDQLENKWPDLGWIQVQDAETGRQICVDTRSAFFKQNYMQQVMEQNRERDQLLKKSQVEKIEVSANGDYIAPLVKFFNQRKK